MKLNLLILIFIVIGCVPEQGQRIASCGYAEAFNSVTRECYSIEAPREIPVASLREVTIEEDSGENIFELTYSDANSDYATACGIVSSDENIDSDGGVPVTCSCVGGSCTASIIPDSNFNGVSEFAYTITDQDGTSNSQVVRVNVTSVDDPPVNDILTTDPVSGSSFDEDTSQTYILGYRDEDGDLATSCSIHSTSTHVNLVTNCSCDMFGICSFTIEGDSDFHGDGEYFTYKVYANEQWSELTFIYLDIDSVNDLPELTEPSQIVTVAEGGTTRFSVTGGTDGDEDDLMYGVVEPPKLDAGIRYHKLLLDEDEMDSDDLIKLDVGEDDDNYDEDYNAAEDEYGLTCLNNNLDLDCRYSINPDGEDVNVNNNHLYAMLLLKTNSENATLRFRAKETGANGTNITVKYVDGASSGAATVDVSSYDITVTIEEDVTTSQTIKEAIEADSSASALVDVLLLGSVPEKETDDDSAVVPTSVTDRCDDGECSLGLDSLYASLYLKIGAQERPSIRIRAKEPGIDGANISVQVVVNAALGAGSESAIVTGDDIVITVDRLSSVTEIVTELNDDPDSNLLIEVLKLTDDSIELEDPDNPGEYIGSTFTSAPTCSTEGVCHLAFGELDSVDSMQYAISDGTDYEIGDVSFSITPVNDSVVAGGYDCRTTESDNTTDNENLNKTQDIYGEFTEDDEECSTDLEHEGTYAGLDEKKWFQITIGNPDDVDNDREEAGEEDEVMTFSLAPGYDIDHDNELSYTLLTDEDTLESLGIDLNGTLTNCLDQSGSDGSGDLTCTYTPEPNASESHFIYRVSDGFSYGYTMVTLVINNTNDDPVVCNYSLFENAQECGLTNCVGEKSPEEIDLVPGSHTDDLSVFYYETDNQICWKSTGTSEGNWENAGDNLFDITINQDEEIVIPNIRVSEGGGGESTQYLRIIGIESSNEELVSVDDIKFEYDGAFGDSVAMPSTDVEGPGGNADFTDGFAEECITDYLPGGTNNDGGDDDSTEQHPCKFGTTSSVDDLQDFTIKVLPTRGVSGSTNITITFIDTDGTDVGKEDDDVDCDEDGDFSNDEWDDCWAYTPKENKISFTVTVKSISAAHNGWKNIKAVGARLGKNHTPMDDEFVCSFSETKCDGGQKCRGEGAPDGSVVSDEFNALYLDESDTDDPVCYRSIVKKTIQNLTYRTKIDSAVAIRYKSREDTDGAVVKNKEQVSVSFFRENQLNYDDGLPGDEGTGTGTEDNNLSFAFIDVVIEDGVSTADTIKSAIEHHPYANLLVSIDDISDSDDDNKDAPQSVFSDPVLLHTEVKSILLVDGVCPDDADCSDTAEEETVSDVPALIFLGKSSDSVSVTINEGSALSHDIDENQVEITIVEGVTTAEDIIDELGDVTDFVVFAGQDESQESIVMAGEPWGKDLKVLSITETSLTLSESAAEWEEFQTYCNISQSDIVGKCRDNFYMGASCIGHFSPSDFKEANVTATCDTLDHEDDRDECLTPHNGDIGGYFMPENFNEAYLDIEHDKCYRSISAVDDPSDDDLNSRTWHGSGEAGGNPCAIGTISDCWETYYATGAVTLSWEDFGVSGTGAIDGFNVYRREWIGANNEDLDTSFDYTSPLNNNPITADEDTFVDSYQSSRLPPIPYTTYHYEVRPIIDGVIAVTEETYNKVRVISPPENMVFVHRDIVNQTICKKMHANERDDLDDDSDYIIQADDHNVCKYHGLGEANHPSYDTGGGYYDIGFDMLVDRFEAGCNYSVDKCNEAGNDDYDDLCIGMGPPGNDEDWKSGIDSSEDGAIYYDRESADCYFRDGGDWFNLSVMTRTSYTEGNADTASSYANLALSEGAGAYNTAQLAPLVNLRQAKALDLCESDNTKLKKPILGLNHIAVPNKRLPNRVEQVAYSQWSDDYSDSEIAVLEAGLSLNSSSKCNSSGASGITDGYSDRDMPDVNFLYSIPGIESSDIRSLMTGSDYTADCQSRFGVQDAVGNVAEWSEERIDCDDDTSNVGSICTSITNSITADVNNRTFTGSDYDFDSDTGPCNESTEEEGCDLVLDEWSIESESYGAKRMSIPTGLPFNEDFTEDKGADADISRSLMDIGPSSGITSSQLHDDKWIINSHYLAAQDDGIGSMSTGGGYNSGGGAGVWSFEFLPHEVNTLEGMSYFYIFGGIFYKTNAHIFTEWTDTPEVPTATVPTFQADEGADDNYSVNDSAESVLVTFGDDGLTDYENIFDSAMTDNTASWIDADSADTEITSKVDETSFVDTSDQLSARPDVGFRCLIRIDEDLYNSD